MLTTFRPKGKPIAASTRNTYYQILNGALNAAVRAKRLLRNPFNEMEKSEKPQNAGERAVVYDHRRGTGVDCHSDTGMGGLKTPICFPASADCVSAILSSLKWKNVFVDNGQYRLAVAMQKTKEPIYLPLSKSVEVDAGA